ncbi:MAG: sigma-70 family RNA polymerase sigma factor, partial [Duncaniella sp.]|nr:sigma-70 family RNA polymerase sigma factor [Duncaniella sp.]
IEQETMDIFFAAIDALPVRYREIVELSFEQGLKNEEVAGLLGITEVAVRKRKIRLIELLREKLGGKLDAETIVVLLGYYCELTRRMAE